MSARGKQHERGVIRARVRVGCLSIIFYLLRSSGLLRWPTCFMDCMSICAQAAAAESCLMLSRNTLIASMCVIALALAPLIACLGLEAVKLGQIKRL
jgi:hypothetical protein